MGLDPGRGQDDHEPDQEQHERDRRDPGWQPEDLLERGCHLDDQPRRGEIDH